MTETNDKSLGSGNRRFQEYIKQPVVTDHMIRAGREASRKYGSGAMREIYTAMVAAQVDPGADAQGKSGGPTVAEPNRPYCKPDQSCCDFTCGN